jgi:hypothetical protein
MSTRLLPWSATAIALVDRPLLHPVKQANAAKTARTTIAMATRCEILFFPSENRIVSSLAPISVLTFNHVQPHPAFYTA